MAEEQQEPQAERRQGAEEEADSGPELPPRFFDPKTLKRFLDVPIAVGVRLDHRRLKARSMLALKENTVIKLNRSAGEKVDLLLDGLLIGAGEIVVIEDMMGLRITDLHYEPPEEEV